jgi:capsule polysaccharide export protein KpsE/RkpR
VNPAKLSTLELTFLRKPEPRKRIAMTVLAGALAGLLYGLFWPGWYRSWLTVVPVGSSKPSLSGILGAQVGGLAGALEGATSVDASRIAAVLQSASVTDAVISRFDLKGRYGERYLENARDELWSRCDVRVIAKPNLAQLSCEDRDPAFLHDMLAFFAEHGNLVFQRISLGSASEEVRFMEVRVSELRKEATERADRMRDFQEKHRIVDLDTQAKAVVTALAGLHAQRVNKQLELEYARTFASPYEVTTRQLESQLSVLNRRLEDIEDVQAAPSPADIARKTQPAAPRGLFPPAMAVPQLRSDMERLYLDRKVAEATLVFAMERLEAARATQAREVSTFQVLDLPEAATMRSRPRPVKSLLMGAALGLAIATLAEAWRGRRRPALASSLEGDGS